MVPTPLRVRGTMATMPTDDPDPSAPVPGLAASRRSGDAGAGARLVDYAESPRVDDWTLRSALVRLAQPEPVRAGAVLELIRRTDAALAPHRRRLERDEVTADTAFGGIGDDELVPLLRPAVVLDALAEVLTAWAAERSGPPPVAEIDRACSTAFEMLEAAGAPSDGGRRRSS